MYSATDLPTKIQNKMRIVPNSSKNFSFLPSFSQFVPFLFRFAHSSWHCRPLFFTEDTEQGEGRNKANNNPWYAAPNQIIACKAVRHAWRKYCPPGK